MSIKELSRGLVARAFKRVTYVTALGGACAVTACSGFSADDCNTSRTCPPLNTGGRNDVDAATPSGGGGSAGSGGSIGNGGASGSAGAITTPGGGGVAPGNGGNDPGGTGGSDEVDASSTVPDAGRAGDAGPEASSLVCPDGHADCNHNASDGCEVELATSVAHCGACSTTCSNAGTTVVACEAGACKATCDATHADCDHDGKTGCEVDLTSDANDCSACGKACSKAGTSSVACVMSQCKPTCDATHADCDKSAANACEVDTAGDVNNCGGCGHKCGSTNTTATKCVAGKCVPTCAVEFLSCDGGSVAGDANGCETSRNSPTSCGDCGRSCQGASCSGGVCQPMTIATNLNVGTELAADSRFAYYVDTDPTSMQTRLTEVPVAGGATTKVADGPITSITSNGTYLYWGTPNTADPTGINFFLTGVVFQSSPSGTKYIANFDDPGPMTADATNLYWFNKYYHILYSRPHSQADPNGSVITNSLADVQALATDGSRLFGTGAGAVFAMDPSSGVFTSVTSLKNNTLHAFGVTIAVDANGAYAWFSDSSKVHLYALSKTTLAALQEVIAAPFNSASSPFLVGGDSAYVVGQKGLYRAPLKGGASMDTDAPFVSGATVKALVYYGGAIYWIDAGTDATKGVLRKLAVF